MRKRLLRRTGAVAVALIASEMGRYTGDPGNGDCEILTDEYRLAEGVTVDVAPGGTS